jgi:hypothetical protein
MEPYLVMPGHDDDSLSRSLMRRSPPLTRSRKARGRIFGELNELPPHPVLPGLGKRSPAGRIHMSCRFKIIAAVAIMLVTGASVLAQAQTASSGSPRAAYQEQGSQLLPEAQPPFAPKPDNKPAQANAAPGAGKSTTQSRSSAATDNAGSGSDTPARSAQCDYRLCANTYRSFDPSNCTYQPYTGGPRRLCER